MKTLNNLMKKYPSKIAAVDHDEDGYWIFLNGNWRWDGAAFIHEDTVKACLEAFSMIEEVN